MNILSTSSHIGLLGIVSILAGLVVLSIFMQIRNNRKTYRFFTPNGIDKRILNLTERDLKSFHPSEQEFIRWYQQEKENGLFWINLTMNMKDINFLSSTSQIATCTEIMRMINAPTIPDPEIF